MPDQRETIQRCNIKLLNNFTTYDQVVDVVSSWESIIKNAYEKHFLYFDRFPVMQPGRLTPDFTILFNEKYGIIFEIKRTFPEDERGFLKIINQLKAYDNKLDFRKDNSNNRITPSTHDIVLVVNADNSNEIFLRISKIIKDHKIEFNNNLIFMEYYFNTTDRTSRYIFRKYAGENRVFRDTKLPNTMKLETILGKQSKSLKCGPEHFMEYKIKQVLCNDKPPEVYLAVILWTKIFYSYLSEEQKREWRLGNTQKIQYIPISIDELKDNLNTNYIPNGNVRRKWISETMKFLEDAELASIITHDEVEVHYRHLTRISTETLFSTNHENEYHHIRHYARLIADQYCKSIHKDKKKEKKYKPRTQRKGKQLKLNNGF